MHYFFEKVSSYFLPASGVWELYNEALILFVLCGKVQAAFKGKF